MAAERYSPRATVIVVACALCTHAGLGAPKARAQESATSASTAIYVRTDTDDTTVITPRIHVGAPLAEQTRLDLVYTVDVWSSASIDIRTAASKRVTEQRDEIDVSMEQGFGDLSLGGSYRYSTEIDYVSHGGSLGAAVDLADKSTGLSLVARGYFDRVGQAGDPDFDRPASMLSARLGLTQVIDPQTLVTLAYEPARQSGYLASPYRFVRFAASAEELPRTCEFPIQMCLRENNPDSRLRHAIAVSGRRALGKPLSVGLGYRYYLDDWKLSSHTISADGAWMPDEAWLVALGYRFYTQSKAEHYEPFYLTMPVPRYHTSDKELSTLATHRVELELSREFALDDAGSLLRAVLLAAPSVFLYEDFPLLERITAFDLTLALEVRL